MSPPGYTIHLFCLSTSHHFASLMSFTDTRTLNLCGAAAGLSLGLQLLQAEYPGVMLVERHEDPLSFDRKRVLI